MALRRRHNSVFVSTIALARNPLAAERLRDSPESEWQRDHNLGGYWVLKGSQTHILAVLLGIEPYTNTFEESGTWDRNGRIK